MEPIECSRCENLYEAIYEYQGDGCACYIDLKEHEPVSVYHESNGELSHAFASWADDAHNAYHLFGQYGSRRHDLSEFAFVNPSKNPIKNKNHLTRTQILKRHLWSKESENNVCDNCIDEMLEVGEIKQLRCLDDMFGSCDSSSE